MRLMKKWRKLEIHASFFVPRPALVTKYEFLTTKMSNSDTKQIYKIFCQIFQPNYADNT